MKSERREKIIRLLLTVSERREIEKAAKRAGLPVASYARSRAVEAARSENRAG